MALKEGMSNEEKLKEMKKQVAEAKEEFSRDQGKLESIEKRLKDEFNISTLAEAESRLAVIDSEIERLQLKVNEDMAYIEKHYEFL